MSGMSAQLENQFIGLGKRAAQNRAEFLNLSFHLIRVDKENFFSYPDDSRTDRVCIEIDEGRVTRAKIR